MEGTREELIKEILDRELAMFLAVRSRGPAPCQQDPASFRRVRSTQFSVWPEQALVSYRRDLEAAEKKDRNLMTLKYARMEGLIPGLHEDPGVEATIDGIVTIQVQWQRELAGKYPNLMARGRPIEDSETPGGATSFAAYLRGELETYSEETLSLLYQDMNTARERGENRTETIYLQTVKGLGYASIEHAEQAVGKRRR